MQVYFDLKQLPKFKHAVVTIGSFDGVHTGHRQIINRLITLARKTGGDSVVITFDPHPRTVLQPGDGSFHLITNTAEKIELIRETGIDYLVIVPFTLEFSKLSAQAYVESFLIKHFDPSYIVIGYDHKFGSNREGDFKFLEKYAIPSRREIVEIDKQEIDALTVSSTKIRQALEAGQVTSANRLLGYPFTLSGTVAKGDQIGRTIGFPTANLQVPDAMKLIPAHGIYAARVIIGNESHNGMFYIGTRPAVNGVKEVRLEVNILDFNRDIYGETIAVEVLQFIRHDASFPNLEALKTQIESDKREICAFFDGQLATKPATESVAIVILNYNTRRQLETFLPGVKACSPGAAIVVADNGSPDDSMEYLRTQHPDVTCIDLKQNYGFAGGYNHALAQVDADIFVILNSDVEVTPGWLTPAIEAMQRDPKIGVVQPKIKAWRNKTHFEYAGASGGWIDLLGYPFCRGRIFTVSEVDADQYDTPQECFWAAGAAFFIRKKQYMDMGGFDADYFAHNEEIDLCWRLKRAGYSVWCIPQSVVYHVGGGTLEYESPKKVFLNFRNSLYSIVKNAPFPAVLFMVLARLLLDGLAGVRFLLKGQFSAIGAVIRAHFSFYRTLGKTLEKRRQTALLIERFRIGPSNENGIFKNSIVWKYYAGGVRFFSNLGIK